MFVTIYQVLHLFFAFVGQFLLTGYTIHVIRIRSSEIKLRCLTSTAVFFYSFSLREATRVQSLSSLRVHTEAGLALALDVCKVSFFIACDVAILCLLETTARSEVH